VLRLNDPELLVDLGKLALDRLLHVGEGVWPGLGSKSTSFKNRYRSQKDGRFLIFTDYNRDLSDEFGLEILFHRPQKIYGLG
jgi:hypothetical protein